MTTKAFCAYAYLENRVHFPECLATISSQKINKIYRQKNLIMLCYPCCIFVPRKFDFQFYNLLAEYSLATAIEVGTIIYIFLYFSSL